MRIYPSRCRSISRGSMKYQQFEIGGEEVMNVNSMDQPEEHYNREMAELQQKVGCAECRFADGTRLGYGDACQHPNGWRPSFGQLHCSRQLGPAPQAQDNSNPAARNNQGR